jgi:hypothetical protein
MTSTASGVRLQRGFGPLHAILPSQVTTAAMQPDAAGEPARTTAVCTSPQTEHHEIAAGALVAALGGTADDAAIAAAVAVRLKG